MKQVTLVILYGQKSDDLSALITACQDQISKILGDCFQPYSMPQIHATFVSLEQLPDSQMTNLYLSKYQNQLKRMNLSGLLNFMRVSGRFPFQVQIGGFQNRDYPFVSQKRRPFERSFSIQGGESAVALMMGWPIRGNSITNAEANTLNLIQEARIYPNTLDKVRRSIQTFNILHKYYYKPTDVDNDLYFRVGLICQSPYDYLLRENVEYSIRHYLSTVKPIIVEIGISNVYVASFQDETLPLDTTRVWSLDDTLVTPEFICSLYE